MKETHDKLDDKELWEEFFNEFYEEADFLLRNDELTYSFPKEEQVRSSLYAFLKDKGFRIELEAKSFKGKKKYGYPKFYQRYDLRIINPKDIIEVKTGLYNITSGREAVTKGSKDEWHYDINRLKEIDKLEGDWNKYVRGSEKYFLLVLFSEDSKHEDSKNLREEADELKNDLKEIYKTQRKGTDKYGTTCHLWVWKIKNGK